MEVLDLEGSLYSLLVHLTSNLSQVPTIAVSFCNAILFGIGLGVFELGKLINNPILNHYMN